MSDQSQPAAVVAREARSIHAGLKTLLARDVWGNYREADFQRKNLRRRYLHLLLLHPTAREARDAGTHLWMQTSYAFIALYKQRLARPHNNNNTNANANNNTGGGGGNNTNGSQVETRKLLQRFRQFLADEERFWRALVLRVRRAPVYSAALPPAEDLAYALPPELLSNGGEDGGDGGGGGSVEERMNHFGFPAAPGPASSTQDGTGVEVMPTAVDEATARSVLSKALVCLGDIARYREQYKAPPPNPKPKNLGLGPGVVRGKTPFEPRPNYGRARSLYLAAHALAPAEGNAAHQLAILAGYESDTLSSLSWYLRALCVRAPFDTAGENLAGVLARVLAGQRQAKSSANVGGGGGKHAQQQDGHHKGKEAKDATSVIDLDALAAKWLSARERDRGADTGIEGVEGGGGAEDDEKEKEEDEKDPPRVRIERFKRAVVLLHALWRDPGAAHATPAYALALAAHIARAFARLVAARALPEELIVRVVLCAQGAVWAGRMRVGVGAGVSANSNTSANGNGSGEGEGEKQLGAGVGAEKGAGAEKEKGRRRRDRYRDRDRDRSSTTPVTASAPTTATLPVPAPQSNTNTKTQKAHLAHLFALHTALLGVGVRELGEVDMYSAPAALASSTMGMGTSAGGAGAAPGGSGKGRRHGRRGDASAGTSGPNTAASAASSTGGVGAVGAGGGVGTAKPELAERISAEFRRTLPALRVASKWLLANWGWVGGVAGLSAANWEKTGKGKEKDGGEGNSLEERELRAQRTRFWATYAEFLRRLGRTFPAGLLPKLTEAASGGDSPPQKNGVHVGEGDAAGEDEEQVELELELEEDVDMRGWLPLRGLMGGPCPLPPSLVSAPSTSTATAGEEDDNESQTLTARKRTVGLREEVHPNVEQLMRIADLLRDARQVVALEGSPLALYGGQFVVKGVEAAKPVEGRGVRVGSGIVPTAPPFVPAAVSAAARLHHQVPVDALASIRARAMHDAEDDDAMTEQTSRTDDDILHDAFSFLNQAGSESEGGAAEASDEDEIVWDLRDAPVSPIVPTARTSPKTPLRLPPIGPPSRGAGASTATGVVGGLPPLSPFRVPQLQLQPQQPITPGMQVPATTALDLLNTFALPKAKPVGVTTPGAVGTGMAMGGGMGMGVGGTGSGESLLFGSRAAPQSIWSASRDEQGLIFAGGSAGAAVGQQQQQFSPQYAPQHAHVQPPQYQGLPYPQSAGLAPYTEHTHPHTHPHAHHQRFASQDFALSHSQSQGSTIWSSSYPSASQHRVSPSASFGPPQAQQHQHQHQHQHQRVVSNSMAAAQLFPSGSDQYGYGPLSAPAPQYVAGMAPEQFGVF